MNFRKRLQRWGLVGVLGLVFGAACTRTLGVLPTPNSETASPAPTTRNALVAEVSGPVEVRLTPGGNWQAAAVGLALNQESQLRTGAEGRALLRLTEGSKIRVGPNTAFTFKILNPFPENLLTALALDKGAVWILLTGGALDVEMPGDWRVAARAAFISVVYEANTGDIAVTCLQGQCFFNDIEIPATYKLDHAQASANPAPMEFADYGVWGVQVPEATQFAYLATEAVAQGNATLPIVPTETRGPSATPRPTQTTPPDQPTPTPAPPTATNPPLPTPRHTQPTSTAVPFTPIPPAPIIGVHTVLPEETIFCIARGYGVLPGAIAQANGLALPYVVYPNQRLSIPEVQWTNISAGPVCPTQFASPFPGLPLPTATVAAPPLHLTLNVECISNCGSIEGSYTLRLTASVSGGLAPYAYDPAQLFELTVSHCTEGQGAVTVTSADGQTTTTTWFYHDVSCVTPGSPGATDTPSTPPTPTLISP